MEGNPKYLTAFTVKRYLDIRKRGKATLIST